MPAVRMRLQTNKPRKRSANLSRVFAVVRIAGLVLLFLLPMQMRAGASDPHPHAMLHLLLDARDGVLDHHDDEHATEHAGHGDHAASPQPDVPAVSASNVATGAMAILAALVVAILVPAARRVTDWPMPVPRVGWLPALEPPPPRSAAV